MSKQNYFVCPRCNQIHDYDPQSRGEAFTAMSSSAPSLAPPEPAQMTEEQRFIADCAKDGMYRQLVEAVGDALDGQLSGEQARWFPVARAVQQQREARHEARRPRH